MTAVDPLAGPIVDTVPQRREWLDRLRGLAIVLMVFDHALALVDPGNPLRLTVTRAAAPLFMLCMAALHKPTLNRRRLALLVAAAAVELVTLPAIGIPLPGIMVGIVAVTVAAQLLPLAAHGYAVAVVGFAAWAYLPLPPALAVVAVVAAWWGLGRCAPWIEVRRYGYALPGWLEPIGRHPLGWYAGHLSALALAGTVLA